MRMTDGERRDAIRRAVRRRFDEFFCDDSTFNEEKYERLVAVLSAEMGRLIELEVVELPPLPRINFVVKF